MKSEKRLERQAEMGKNRNGVVEDLKGKDGELTESGDEDEVKEECRKVRDVHERAHVHLSRLGKEKVPEEGRI